MTCEEMAQTYSLSEDCCSLSTDPETGNCVVTISDGNCIFHDNFKCALECFFETCDVLGVQENCFPPHPLMYYSNSSKPCPTPDFEASNLEDDCPPCKVDPSLLEATDASPALPAFIANWVPMHSTSVNVEPHLTFHLMAEKEDFMNDPSDTEIEILKRQMEDYIWDVLGQDYDIKDISLDNFGNAYVSSEQNHRMLPFPLPHPRCGPDNNLRCDNDSHKVPSSSAAQFELSFSVKIDVRCSPKEDGIKYQSVADTLSKTHNLNKLVNQYAHYTPTGKRNGSFYQVHLVQARIIAPVGLAECESKFGITWAPS